MENIDVEKVRLTLDIGGPQTYTAQPHGSLVKNLTCLKPFIAVCFRQNSWKYVYQHSSTCDFWETALNVVEKVLKGEEVYALINPTAENILSFSYGESNKKEATVDPEAYKTITNYGIF